MSKTKKYLQKKAMDRIPAPALDVLGKAMLKAVDKAVEDRWPKALQMASETRGYSVDDKVAIVLKTFKRELTAVGAATGAVAAAPGIGTAAAGSALVADLGWFGVRATDLVMTIGAIHGHTDSTPEERRAWVLAVLAFGEDAANQFATLMQNVDSSMAGGDLVSARAASMFGGDAATLDALRRVNSTLATQVLKKYGTRRSALAVGKLLPFGIGAVVGGSANYAFVRVVGKQADRFFASQQNRSRFIDEVESSPEDPKQRWLFSVPEDQDREGAKGRAMPPMPPPPNKFSTKYPNPEVQLSESDRRNAIPTDGTEK